MSRNIRKLWIGILFMFVIIAISQCNKITGLDESEVERRVMQLINEHRESLQLDQLRWDETLAGQCRQHSNNMAEGNIPVGHTGFDQRVVVIRDAIPGSLAFGENVALISGWSDPTDIVVDEWLNNPDHRKNIEGDYNLTAVGVAIGDSKEYFLTQIFVKSK